MSSAFVSAVGLGLLAAAPIGPVGLLCISRSLRGDAASGLLTGLGAASVHAGWAFVATMGLHTALSATAGVHSGDIASCAAAAMLFALGWRALASAASSPPANGAATTGARLAAYGSGAALALANPVTVVLFAAAIPAVAPSPPAGFDGLTLALGTFAGSTAWWLALSSGVASFRARFSDALIRRLNRLSGVALIAASALLLARTVAGSGA